MFYDTLVLSFAVVDSVSAQTSEYVCSRVVSEYTLMEAKSMSMGVSSKRSIHKSSVQILRVRQEDLKLNRPSTG